MAENKNEIAVIKADDLIVVKQIPIITEQLKAVKPNIEAKIKSVLALGCTEGTVKAIKALRSDLNNDFKLFEERRKAVKRKILEPYDKFETVYKECVTEQYQTADAELKARIDEVENKLKAEKQSEIEAYFYEYRNSKGIDFIDFSDTDINITKTASKKSLKEAAKAFIDRICDDLALIETQEYKEEILVEYKQSLNVSSSITQVVARHKAIEEEREKAEQAAEEKQKRRETAEKVMKAAEAAHAPLSAPKTVDDEMCRMTFTVLAKRSKMVALKQFIVNDGGYEIVK